MIDEYTKNLHNELEEANETIGSLICCLEMVLDKNHTKRAKMISRALIEKIRSERIYRETEKLRADMQ